MAKSQYTDNSYFKNPHYVMFHRTRIKCEQRPGTICGNSLISF